MNISLYSFEDEDGPHGTFTTYKAQEAEAYARKYNLLVIDNVYEWAEAVPVEGWDFRPLPRGQ